MVPDQIPDALSEPVDKYICNVCDHPTPGAHRFSCRTLPDTA